MKLTNYLVNKLKHHTLSTDQATADFAKALLILNKEQSTNSGEREIALPKNDMQVVKGLRQLKNASTHYE